MRQSNSYIIIFALVLCVIIGGSLATVNEVLKPRIKANEAKEKKVNILSAVSKINKGVNIDTLYAQSIISDVVYKNGESVPEAELVNDQNLQITPEQVDIRKEYKKLKAQRKNGEEENIFLPVFKKRSEVNPEKIEAYIFPIYGAGLWDDIWGYLAVSGDFSEILGVVFDHKAETPGLGARITNNKDNTGSDNAFQERFKGKGFLKEGTNNEFYELQVVKGEGNSFTEKEEKYKIDGLSGASMTTNGVNAMLNNYIGLYREYIIKETKGRTDIGMTEEQN